MTSDLMIASTFIKASSPSLRLPLSLTLLFLLPPFLPLPTCCTSCHSAKAAYKSLVAHVVVFCVVQSVRYDTDKNGYVDHREFLARLGGELAPGDIHGPSTLIAEQSQQVMESMYQKQQVRQLIIYSISLDYLNQKKPNSSLFFAVLLGHAHGCHVESSPGRLLFISA